MAKRGARQRARQLESRRSGALNLGLVLLLLTIGVSGLGLADAAHDMRGLYREMGEVQREQDAALAVHSRLLLERSALSSLNNIERIASDELDMEFPRVIGEVLE